MRTREFDLVVIGAGPAGESAAETAAAARFRVAIVERAKAGGTVVASGGAPTKTLREAMLAMTGFHNRDVYGVTVTAPFDVMAQKITGRTRQVSEFLQHVTTQNILAADVEYIEGAASITPGRRVVVSAPEQEDLILSARIILIATGSRPLHPPGIPFDDPDVWDTDKLFSSRGRLPSDILIVGGGAVGVEFATVFAGLGIKTIVLEASDRLLPNMDGEMSALLRAHFGKIGVDVILGTGVSTVARVDRQLEVRLGNGSVLRPDAVLFAAGRSVDTNGLGLAEVGVELDSRGRIKVDRNYMTAVEGIYAAGDVVGPTLASIAMDQGRAAARNAFGMKPSGAAHRTAGSAVYGMPEIAGVGLTEEQCKLEGIDYEVGRADFSRVPRGAIAGHGGVLKLIFRRSNRKLLGVHCIGDIASEVVGMGQMVMHFGGAIDAFAEVTLNTPTYSFAYKYAAADGMRRVGAEAGGKRAYIHPTNSAH